MRRYYPYIGERVMFTDPNAHKECPRWYPPKGTIGTVVQCNSVNNPAVRVQWPDGTTGGNGCWYTPVCDLRPAPETEG